MSTEDNKQVARRFNEEPWNEGRLDVLDELSGPSYRWQDGSGIDVLKEAIPEFRRAFPDMRLAVEEIIAEGDAVVVRWTWTGTHLGQFQDVAPTGKVLKNTGITIYHFADGKIVDDYFESSGPDTRQQLLGAQ